MTTTKHSMSTAKIAIEPVIADRLLDLLSTDNDFRREFKKDPATALLRIGHVPTKQGAAVELAVLRASLSVDRLATKECIARSREEIRKMLTQGLAMIPIQLNAADNQSGQGQSMQALPTLRAYASSAHARPSYSATQAF